MPAKQDETRTCIAPKRAIVDKRVKAAFEQKVLEKVALKRLAEILSFWVFWIPK